MGVAVAGSIGGASGPITGSTTVPHSGGEPLTGPTNQNVIVSPGWVGITSVSAAVSLICTVSPSAGTASVGAWVEMAGVAGTTSTRSRGSGHGATKGAW